MRHGKINVMVKERHDKGNVMVKETVW